MEDKSIANLSKEQLIVFVKRLRDKTLELKNERDAAETSKEEVIGKAKNLISRLREANMKIETLESERDDALCSLKDGQDIQRNLNQELKSPGKLTSVSQRDSSDGSIMIPELNRGADPSTKNRTETNSCSQDFNAFHYPFAEQPCSKAESDGLMLDLETAFRLKTEADLLAVNLQNQLNDALAQGEKLAKENEEIKSENTSLTKQRDIALSDSNVSAAAAAETASELQGKLDSTLSDFLEKARDDLAARSLSEAESSQMIEKMREESAAAAADVEALRVELEGTKTAHVVAVELLSTDHRSALEAIKNEKDANEGTYKERLREVESKLKQDHIIDLDTLKNELLAESASQLLEQSAEATTATAAAATTELQMKLSSALRDAARVPDLETALMRLTLESEALHSKELSLKSVTTPHEAELKTLTSSSEELTSNNEALTNRATHAETNLTSAIASIADLKAERAEAKSDLSQLRGQLKDLNTRVALAESEVASTKEALSKAEDELSKQDCASRKARMSAPSFFTIVLRVHDGTNVWCLISTHKDKGKNEDNSKGKTKVGYANDYWSASGGTEEVAWRPDALVQEWLLKRAETVPPATEKEGTGLSATIISISDSSSYSGSGTTAGAFSIENEDDIIGGRSCPLTIQEELEQLHSHERLRLEEQLVILQRELSITQEALYKFRERTRESTSRASSDRKAAEAALADKIHDLEAELASVHSDQSDYSGLLAAAEKAQSDWLAKEARLVADTETATVLLKQERSLVASLSEKHLELEDKLRKLRLKEDAQHSKQNELHTNESNADTATLHLQVVSASYEVADLKEQIIRLSRESKKRSEAAREMCSIKDAELNKAAEMVKQLRAELKGYCEPPSTPNHESFHPSSFLSLSGTSSFGSHRARVRFTDETGGMQESERSRDQSVSDRIEYLGHAYKRFVLTDSIPERQSLATVICTILQYPPEELKTVVTAAADRNTLSLPPVSSMGISEISMPELSTIERYSIEQLSVENVTASLSSWLGLG